MDAAGLVAIVMVTGCASNVPSLDEVNLPGDQEGLVGQWQDRSGRLLPDGTNDSGGILVVHSNAGSSTCSAENATVFMALAWPPGRQLDSKKPEEPGEYNRYMRDTTGSQLESDGVSDLRTELPKRAVSTGIHREGNTIHAIPSKGSAIWIQRADGHIERWPRLKTETGCA